MMNFLNYYRKIQKLALLINFLAFKRKINLIRNNHFKLSNLYIQNKLQKIKRNFRKIKSNFKIFKIKITKKF